MGEENSVDRPFEAFRDDDMRSQEDRFDTNDSEEGRDEDRVDGNFAEEEGRGSRHSDGVRDNMRSSREDRSEMDNSVRDSGEGRFDVLTSEEDRVDGIRFEAEEDRGSESTEEFRADNQPFENGFDMRATQEAEAFAESDISIRTMEEFSTLTR